MNASIENKILYEHLLQEAFLDSVKAYAQEKYNQVITKITDWKDAAVIIGKVISNPTILDRFSDNVWYDFKKNILSKLISFLNKIGLESLITQINNIVNKITNLSGWQKFLAATGIGAIANYVVEKISRLAPDAIKNFINTYLSDSGLKNIISKLTDFKSYLGWLQPIIKGTEMLYDILKSSIDKFNKDSKLFTQSINLIRKEEMNIKEYIKSLVRELLDEESTSGDAGGYLSAMAFSKKGQGPNAATKQAQRSGWKLAPGMPKNSKVLDYKELWKGKKSAMNESLRKIIEQELLNEVTYSKFKNEVKFRTKNEQLHKAIREVKRKLMEIDRIVEYTSRMKQELSEGEEGVKYWKATQKNVATISEMVNHLNNKIKNLQQ